MEALLAAWLVAAIIVGASVLVGAAILRLAGQESVSLLAGGVGFAALVTVAHPLIGLPGRALTAAIIIGIALVAAAIYLWRTDTGIRRGRWVLPAAVAVAVIGLGSTPFLFTGHVGVLGEGIYTNDLAAQLFWTDWLQRGFGPEPYAVGFGYPFGPQSLTATVAEATTMRLDAAFNGLLLAIAALTGLAALALVRRLAGWKRFTVGVMTAMPYLAASFLAQSAFKETAMALFVVVLAIALQHSFFATPCEDEPTDTFTPRHEDEEQLGGRALTVILLLIATASVFTFSLPGLAWPLVIVTLWLLSEVMLGGRSIPIAKTGEWVRTHRLPIVIGAVAVVAIAVVGSGGVVSFIDKIGLVQESSGRLRSPVFVGEAFGIWPEGDFQLVRGDVTGSEVATLIGLAALLAGAWVAWCRYRYGVLSALLGCILIYIGARLGASFYVSAKALAIMAPLVMLVSLSGLLIGGGGRWARAGVIFGIVVAVLALASSLLALRSAPVGWDDRGRELESLVAEAEGESLVFLGVDRFAAWWLRDSLAASPGGYLPNTTKARPQKAWQQGWPMDFDTPKHLDRFDYVITTTAPFQSRPWSGYTEVARGKSYVLWKGSATKGESQDAQIPKEGPDAGIQLGGSPSSSKEACFARLVGSMPSGKFTLSRPQEVELLEGGATVGEPDGWLHDSPMRAPGSNSIIVSDVSTGELSVSLQYHSQVELTVSIDGTVIGRMPPSLVGMYLTNHGQSAYWRVGSFVQSGTGPVVVTVEAASPSGIPGILGTPHNFWLGRIALSGFDAVDGSSPVTAEGSICGEYLDRVSATGSN